MGFIVEVERLVKRQLPTWRGKEPLEFGRDGQIKIVHIHYTDPEECKTGWANQNV
jgi:hypothetical protein